MRRTHSHTAPSSLRQTPASPWSNLYSSASSSAHATVDSASRPSSTRHSLRKIQLNKSFSSLNLPSHRRGSAHQTSSNVLPASYRGTVTSVKRFAICQQPTSTFKAAATFSGNLISICLLLSRQTIDTKNLPTLSTCTTTPLPLPDRLTRQRPQATL